MRFRLPLIFPLILLGFYSQAQYALDGFSLQDSTLEWFDQQIGLQANEIFTGVYESFEYRPAVDQIGWNGKIWSVGNLHYRGNHYADIYLFHDLENDVLFTRNHLNSDYFNQPIRLNQEQVAWFTIDDELLVRTNFPELNASEGFYMQLFETGSFGMYLKREKIQEIEVGQIRLRAKDSFFLTVSGQHYRVYRPSSLYKLFKELKPQLKVVFKSLNVRKFDKATIGQMKSVARRCAPIISQS